MKISPKILKEHCNLLYIYVKKWQNACKISEALFHKDYSEIGVSHVIYCVYFFDRTYAASTAIYAEPEEMATVFLEPLGSHIWNVYCKSLQN